MMSLVIGRPNVDITELKDNEKFSFTVEVDVRPEIELPNFSTIEITVDDVAVSEGDIDEQVAITTHSLWHTNHS